jgi:hypothetical protein
VFAVVSRATGSRVREIVARLQAAGLPSRLLTEGHMPHVSLAVCDELDPGPFAVELGRFAAGERPLGLSLVSVSTFATAEGVLFLGAVKTRALLELHKRFFPLREGRAGRGTTTGRSVVPTARSTSGSRRPSSPRRSRSV